MSLEEAERRHIGRILAISKDLDEAARVLRIDPTTLWRKRKKYGL
ncbi:MAG TPA: helix-turn-helix domain-containing protein [Bacteroidota bacterium]|nr:helix-turn-helix domain-containing protein [Bacteroidota bacterium]